MCKNTDDGKTKLQKYWREVVSNIVYTLNWVQVKKGTQRTPFELWYAYAPNVVFFNVFGSKCYIWKMQGKEKLMQKVIKVYS